MHFHHELTAASASDASATKCSSSSSILARCKFLTDLARDARKAAAFASDLPAVMKEINTTTWNDAVMSKRWRCEEQHASEVSVA